MGPDTVHAHDSFNPKKLLHYISEDGLQLRPVPPWRHKNNLID